MFAHEFSLVSDNAMYDDRDVGRRDVLKTAGSVLAGTYAGTSAVAAERKSTQEQLEPADLSMALEYESFPEPSFGTPSYQVSITYPATDESGPGIRFTGLYGVDVDDSTQDPKLVDQVTEHSDTYHEQLDKSWGHQAYDALIEDTDFSIAEVIAENGDSLYGVFDTDTIDFTTGSNTYELTDDEKLLADTPEDAVATYLDHT